MKKIFLSIPYTGMEKSSFKQANLVSALIIKKFNFNVFSPISHFHPIVNEYNKKNESFLQSLPTYFDFWKSNNKQFIDFSNEIWILVPKEGISFLYTSKNVISEIKYAKNNNKKIEIIFECKINKDGNISIKFLFNKRKIQLIDNIIEIHNEIKNNELFIEESDITY